MTNELRDYQQDTINNIYKSMRAGHRHIVVQQPPRTGKTVIMAEIAKRATDKHNRVLTVVHRQELVEQTQKIFSHWGVDMSACRIGMVQTLWRRVKRRGGTSTGNLPRSHSGKELLPPDVIIIDEAHHALARSYRTVLEAYPDAVVLMFTATPYRLSGAGMGEVADDLIQGLQVSELIDKGYLAPVKYFAPPDINTELLKRQHGEFTEQSITDALAKRVYGNAVDQYKKHASGMKAIAYCHSIESAKRLADEFTKNGIPALEVDGNTPKDERAAAVERFRNGDITVMTNVELFTEGLDLPNVDCVIQLRPTQSLALYLQFSMRAMNPRKGKTAVILDHVGNLGRFGLPTADREWTLENHTKQASHSSNGDEPSQPISTCPFCFGVYDQRTVKDDLCPLCGTKLPEAAPEEPDEVDGDLEEVSVPVPSAAELRLKRVHEMQRQNAIKEIAGKNPWELNSMRELQLYATFKGYKPGWAYYQAKERGIEA